MLKSRLSTPKFRAPLPRVILWCTQEVSIIVRKLTHVVQESSELQGAVTVRDGSLSTPPAARVTHEGQRQQTMLSLQFSWAPERGEGMVDSGL